MVRNLVVLADGTEVFSGGEGSAVMALELTESVSTGKELAPGAVCAAMAQLTLLDMGDVKIAAGDALTLHTVDEAGSRRETGVFLAEKPERNGQILQVTAYDRLILLDKDLTLWLGSLEGWPYSLQSFGQMVCQTCGLEMASQEIPNGDFPVAKFTADGVTGRQLLGWVAEAAGCFCRLNGQGQPEMCWYTPAPVALGSVEQAVRVSVEENALSLTLPEDAAAEDGTVMLESPYLICGDDGEGSVTLTVREGLLRQYYYQGALALEAYRTSPIERVQLRQSAEDVGTFWPDVREGNTLAITGNPLLAAVDAQTLLPVAQTLYDRFAGTTYTPCTLELPDTPGLAAGQVLTLFDSTGQQHSVYIMELSRSAKGLRVSCTGSPSRDSSTAVNHQSLKALNGKVLNLRMDVDGLKVENSDSAGKFSRLELDIEGIRGQVSAQNAETGDIREQLTRVEQTADALKISVESIQNEGAAKLKTAMGYTFDDNGLQIAREGQQMKNLLDNTGMYVTRAGQTILQANDKGVVATDVTVRNYLIVGSHARFEDYGAGRTACFYLEG